jgi:L-seryl-tRNA(Ser) seleniumtransferase
MPPMSDAPPTPVNPSLYRRLPGVDTLLQHPDLAGLPHAVAANAARQVLAELRDAIGAGLQALPADLDAHLAAQVAERARMLGTGRLRRVINATGVVIHTNLGRAPWGEAARQAAIDAMGYCNLEMRLDTGRRGGRLEGVAAQMRALTGAEDAIVVNNCAAAVLLALTALAKGREVLVSRGELVEIGGSFRVPEVIASGGARLVEVGATNRTRVADFAAGLTEDSAAILRVHPSNFHMSGFTERPDRADLARLARERGVWMLEDLGSGLLQPRPDGASDVFDGEEPVRDVLDAGAHLVMFSGDKLLGGPQAGLIAGDREAVQRCRRHPMYRAMRVDKVILAAVEGALATHLRGETVPSLAMIEATQDALEARATKLSDLLTTRGIAHQRGPGSGVVGGGALPGETLASWVVTLPGDDALARNLRIGSSKGANPVVGRLASGQLVLDVRTLADDELEPLADALVDAIDRRDIRTR